MRHLLEYLRGFYMSRPKLIIMAGPPAAGKTTSAPLLARALGVPLFGLDQIKERLADVIGAEASEYPDRLAHAAMSQVIATASELLTSGNSVMIEGFMRHGQSEHVLAPLVAISDAVLIHLRADDLVLKNRYEARAVTPERHWIHGDLALLGTLLPELPLDMAAPLELGISRIFIDTSDGPFSVDEVAALVTDVLQAPEPADYAPISPRLPAES